MTASQTQPAESQGYRRQSEQQGSQGTQSGATGQSHRTGRSQWTGPSGQTGPSQQGGRPPSGIAGRDSGQQGAAGGRTTAAQQPLVGQLYPTTNHLPEEVRTTSIAVCNQALVDATVLLRQVRTAHWNVKGLHFRQLHELFEEVAETIEAYVDTIAERATALGGQAIATVPIAAQHTTLPPLSPNLADGEALLDEIAQRLSLFDTCLYRNMHTAEEAGDLDTVDLLNEVSREVSKALWLVESHLHRPASGGSVQAGAAQTSQGTGWQ